MVLFGLTVIVVDSTKSNTAVSPLILTFLVPAVLFSAVAGVYVDRIDRRTILVATNILRGLAFIALYLVGDQPRADPAAQCLRLDGDRVLRASRGGDDPRGRRTEAAARGERDLHDHAERRLRDRVRAPRSARREHRVAGGGDPGRRLPVPPRRGLLLHAPEVAPAAARGRPRARRLRGGACRRLDALPAHRGPELHPLQPVDQLVAALSRDHGLARRRPRRPRTRLRAGDPRPRRQGLRRRRAAARVRDRDRHPAAQRLRSLPPAPAGHRGRPDRARPPAGAARRRRTDQPAPAAGGRPGRPRLVRRHLAAGGRGRDRALRRDRVRVRGHPGADPAPGGPAGGGPRPRVRRPQHAGLGRELRADHHRRADLRRLRDDRRDHHRRALDLRGRRPVIRETGALDATHASPAADPHIVDPLASALGADLPTWHDPEMPTERYVASAGASAVATPTPATPDPPHRPHRPPPATRPLRRTPADRD